MKNVLDELGVSLVRVVVTDMQEHTYFAELHLERGGQLTTVSSRPSDSIALAVRTGSPIFADERVVEEYAQEQEDDEAVTPEEGEEEILEEFRDFIENVNPEDFQSR
jgi:bifunctional DNase/RNase